MEIVSVMSDLTSFGAAGLMGSLWLWERKLSRRREQQLDDAHQRILRDEERLEKFTEVVQQNTAAIARFHETQREACEILKHLVEEYHHVRTR